MIPWLVLQVNKLSEWRRKRMILRRRINTSLKCPACGHSREHRINAAETTSGMMIEHTCVLCSAKFYESPILPREKWHARVEVSSRLRVVGQQQ